MLSQEQLQRYDQDGFLVVKKLLTSDECEQLKKDITRLIDNWEPDEDYSWIFPDGENKDKSSSRQLIESSDQISMFVEEGAVDRETGKLNRDKHLSVGYMGHGMHFYEPNFQTIVFSDRIKNIARDLKYIKPAIRQTLYISKQPFIGKKVVSHRDSTYFFNEPLKAFGLWIALEDATVNNGCLWFIPGSHTTSGNWRYIRNPNEEEFNNGKMLIFTGAEEFDDSAFVPQEVKAGDAILFDVQTVHKSEQNLSPQSRQIIALHIFEAHNSVYGKENWLQLSKPFPLLYDDE